MSDRTIALADDKTLQMENKDVTRLVLKKNIIVGKKNTYKIDDVTAPITIGGESQVYLSKCTSDSRQYVIKIYDTFSKDDHQKRISRKAILEFLNNNSADYKNNHIMPLFDYGEIDMHYLDDEEPFTRPFDVIPYCKDGELKGADYNKLKNKIIPELLIALNLLHTNNFVHRDLKPSNIYLYDNVILLADFGTTSKILDTSSHSKTQTKRGTPGYTAPEISDAYFVTASDYYSLGCTIATLYNKGHHIYKNLLIEKKFDEVNIAMRREGLPLECPSNEEDLQLLVNALVLREEKHRAGYEAVNLWLKNTSSFVSMWKNVINQGLEKASLAFKFNENTVCNTCSELTEAIIKDWEKGKRYLYSGTIKNAFDKFDQILAMKAYDIVENPETGRNRDLGLAMFLHYINTIESPVCPIYWCGSTYEELSDISVDIFSGKADKNKIIAMLKSKFLSWKYKNTQGTTQVLIDGLIEIENITDKYPEVGYYYLMWRFPANKDLLNQSPDEVFNELTENGIEWYNKAKSLLSDDRTFAYLICKGFKINILDLKKNLTAKFILDNGDCDLFLLYKLFEGICTEKKKVREHFLKYGPLAYLYWIQQNIHLYSFNSLDAKEIEKQIKNIEIDSNMNITDIFNGLGLLRSTLLDRFLEIFQNNFLLPCMGLLTKEESTGITTKNTHAYFIGNFYGISVPVGYLKSIGVNKEII